MTRLPVSFHFDLVCPWCLIGLRHLRTAIAAFGHEAPAVEVSIDWRSQILLPDIPPAGIPYQAFYERRLGGPAAVAARRAQVQAAAHDAGLTLAFERIRLMPNTTLAHRLIARLAARDPEQVGAFVDRLLTAFFIDGGDIGCPRTLTGIGATFGLTAAETAIDQVAATRDEGLTLWDRNAIDGVPHFVVGRQQFSGALPPAVLIGALRAAIATPDDRLR